MPCTAALSRLGTCQKKACGYRQHTTHNIQSTDFQESQSSVKHRQADLYSQSHPPAGFASFLLEGDQAKGSLATFSAGTAGSKESAAAFWCMWRQQRNCDRKRESCLFQDVPAVPALPEQTSFNQQCEGCLLSVPGLKAHICY